MTDPAPVTTRSTSIAWNSTLNLIGFSIPLVVGLAAVPVITSELGAARFGLLSLAFALLEYSSFFDFGLGSATTREVSAALATKDNRLSDLITGSLVAQMALAALGALVLIAAAPLLATRVFSITPDLEPEAIRVFQVLALMVPPTVALLSLRGILEAASRFDLSNAVRIPSSIATFLIPAIAATRGVSLPMIVVMLLVTRVAICAVMVALVVHALPGRSWRLRAEWSTLRPLFILGGWMSVSNIVSPLLVYLDRFMLGALVGLAAVGYYTAPFDGVMRLLIVPASLMAAVYPSVSGMVAVGDHESARRVFNKAINRTIVILILPALVLFLAGPWLLRVWLGPSFADQADTAIRILAFGVLINAIAHVPSGVIRAFGRPDINAKLHVLELMMHAPAAWFLITRFGVSGAAAAWTLRVSLDAVLLLIASRRLILTAGRTPATKQVPMPGAEAC